MSRFFKVPALGVLFLAVTGVFMGEGPRAETACTELLTRLDEIEAQAGAGNSKEELKESQELYEQLNCPTMPTEAGCQEIATRINRLQNSGAEHGNLGRERARLMQAIRREGCLKDRPDGAPPGAWDDAIEGARNPELFRELYKEGGEGREEVLESQPGQPAGTPEVAGTRGAYRTLCVRSCDGFYWPISFAARSGGFGNDAAACKASCPNQDVALYYHRPGTPSEEALSAATNEPYSSLANALHYRSKYERSCQCVLPQEPDPEAVRKAQEREQERAPEVKVIPEEGKSDAYRSAPVVSPEMERQSPGKASGPNGLRGASQ